MFKPVVSRALQSPLRSSDEKNILFGILDDRFILENNNEKSTIVNDLRDFINRGNSFSSRLRHALVSAISCCRFEDETPHLHLAQLVIEASRILASSEHTPDAFKEFVSRCHEIMGTGPDAETVVYSSDSDLLLDLSD